MGSPLAPAVPASSPAGIGADRRLLQPPVRLVRALCLIHLTSPEPARPFKEAGGERLFSDRPGLYRFDLTIDQPADGAGVFVPLLADNALLHVNGALVRGVDGRWSETPNRRGKAGMIWEVPPALLRAGANELRLLVIRDCCQTYVGAIYAGPQQGWTLYGRTGWRSPPGAILPRRCCRCTGSCRRRSPMRCVTRLRAGSP